LPSESFMSGLTAAVKARRVDPGPWIAPARPGSLVLGLGHLPVEVGADEAVGVAKTELVRFEERELVRVDRPATP